MARGNIRAGGAFVEIFGKDMLDKSLKAAGANFQAFGKTVTAVGAGIAASGTAALAPLLAMTKIFATVGDDAQKAALRTGATTNAISELGYAAQQSGSSLSDVETGIKNMQRRMREAAKGTESAVEAFADLGISIEQLQGLSPDQQFELIADRLASLEDPAQRAALAMEVFGRSGVNLLPLMESGAAGIKTLREEAVELGASIDQADADAAAALGDAWARAKTSFTGAAVQVGAALAPALQHMADVVTGLVIRTRDWLKENRAAVVTVAAVAAGAVVAGTALIGLGAAISAVGTALSAAVALFGTVTAVVTAIINPINLVIAALAAAGVALLVFSVRGLNAFGAVREAAAGIADAVRAGDLEAAWNIALLALEVLFLEWKNRILTIWDAFIDELLKRAAKLDPLAITLTKGGDQGEQDERAAKRQADIDDAVLRYETARLTAFVDAEIADMRRETDRLLREQEAAKRATEQAEQLQGLLGGGAAAGGEGGEFGGPAGLIASAIASAIEMGTRAAKDMTSTRLDSRGTFLSGVSELLGGSDTIDKEQLDAAKELIEETRGVKRAVERNRAVFI